MVFAPKAVELEHLDAVADVAAAGDDVSPFAVQVDERQVDETVDDENPHHCEVPVPRAGEPAAERQPSWYRRSRPRIAAEQLALSRERRISVEDLETGADHDRDGDHVYPMCQPDYPVVALADHFGNYLGTRVCFLINLFQPLDTGMRVDLRRRYRSVTQQLLHCAQVGPGVQQVRGESVSQRVRGKPRALVELLEEPLHRILNGAG